MLSHSVWSVFLRPLDCSLPSSSVHVILQASIVKCMPVPSSMGSSRTWHGPTSLMSLSLVGEVLPLVSPETQAILPKPLTAL